MKKALIFLFVLSMVVTASAQHPLITNIASRQSVSLNGKWQYIIDPYETGFYNYRYQERSEKDGEAYWTTDIPANKSDRKEHGYALKNSLKVPGDWNSQDDKLLYYEGTVWYRRTFDLQQNVDGKSVWLYFGGVNYECHVYLNGKKLGSHKGGFTSFNLPVPAGILKPKANQLVVKVDNKRAADEVPTLNTDWWNYGGITRDVSLLILPQRFVTTYSLQLQKGDGGSRIEGRISLYDNAFTRATVSIPELKLQKEVEVRDGAASFTIDAPGLVRWSTSHPKRYDVEIRTSNEILREKIGFRKIEVKGSEVLLNGKPLFLRGICTHEEIASEGRRAYSAADDLKLLMQAKELKANMVRLAHYPYNEHMARIADSLGMLLWSEIPVYWTIRFGDTAVLAKAKTQLREMIDRDRNRASIIIWSVGNETPVNAVRTSFMRSLVEEARQLDPSRLISAALEHHREGNRIVVDDPLGAFTDLVSVNEYLGWYGSPLPDVVRDLTWDVKYDKPFFISETGAEALGGFHADSLTRWSEEYQEWYYREQVAMFKRMPSNFVGLSPWIMVDFRSPRRNNPQYQQGWNNKGLVSSGGKKKKAFYVMKKYYEEKERE